MAYAAVASLSQTADLILNYHQDSISPQFKYQITCVQEHTNFLQSFLEDFPDEFNAWEERMREVTNVAEDIIELLLSDSLQESTVGSSKSKFIHPPKEKYELRYDYDALERVTYEIESIVIEVKERHKEAVHSFDGDLTEIISRLRGGLFVLTIIPIVGMEGTGKTTLARNAFNNPLIVETFSIHAWATVSQNYSRRKIMLDLLVSMNMNKLNSKYLSNSEEELHERVYNILLGKRYIIVLDDIWSLEAWNNLKLLFPNNNNGSRILLTTRMPNLHRHITYCSHIHQMRALNVDQSWNLLRQKVFKHDSCSHELEYVGKMIARCCKGLPLPIEVLSGILADEKTEAAWEDILENVKTANNCEYNELLLQIFYISYAYLPHHLRSCWLYLGFFPEDQDIRVSKLIKLWAAEGFLHQSGSKSFEETGEEYLEDLVRRSLVLVSKRKSDGRIKSVSIHDLMREMCIRQAHLNNFFLCIKNVLQPVAINLQRRVSIFSYNHNFLKNVCGSTIRTTIFSEGCEQGSGCSLENLRLLRILDLPNSYSSFKKYDLPDELFELFHLRYLAFDYPFNIPKAILNLENLQTLIIRPRKNSRKFVKLPEEIWRMPELRHVVVHSFELPSQEGTMFALENLQTLTEAVNFVCSRETLKLIPNLEKLGVYYTEWRNPEKDYQLHNLMFFQKLEILKIAVYNPLRKQHRINLALHSTLKKLSLSSLGLPWKDMTFVGSLPNLQVLKLRDHACVGNTWKTIEREFSQLMFLLIDKSDLKHWVTESSHFPRLKSLVLYHCKHLREVPNDIREIPTLELIEVDDWNKSLTDSAKQIN